MDSHNGVRAHQLSAVKVSPGRGFFEQDVMGWKLNSVTGRKAPLIQRASLGRQQWEWHRRRPPVQMWSCKGAGANIYTDLLM